MMNIRLDPHQTRCAFFFSHLIRDPVPGLFDQSLIHSQYPILLGGLQSSLHLLSPHLQLDMQTLEQLKRMDSLLWFVKSQLTDSTWASVLIKSLDKA